MSSNRPPPLSLDDPNVKLVDAGPQSPIVILLGWVNCKMKHLNNYVDTVYNPLGFTSLALKVPDVNHWVPSKMRLWSERLLVLIEDLGLQSKDRPLILQTFSGNSIAYSHLADLYSHDQRYSASLQNIKGQVFDSSGIHTISVLAAYDALTKEGKWNAISKWLLWLSLKILQCVLVDEVKLNREFQRRMKDNKIRVPTLLFYTPNDDLIPEIAIDRLIEQLKQHGVSVKANRWEDSQHVRHLKTHKEEYKAAVGELVKETCRPKAKL
ncbi:hypothetical protein PROFUN_07137 [Planoprotostelium fungivorum]|uniref:Transmembrane protein 53-like n=1 Tax=Planoprotostelium fungivorum TaxID=1890364 RepID=A0A2P6NMK1_9EUKA|nr:hypothetical protein PROFUN_07137 [Planoprotostelium fungivorum]